MKKLTNKVYLHRKDLQEALKESEARFRSIVLWSMDAIIVTDAKGKIEYMNPAAERVFNRKIESFIGKDFGMPLVDGKSTEIDIFRPGKEPGVGEMHVVETKWLNKKAHLIMIRDITEHKKLEMEREKMNKKLEQLALKDSHTGLYNHRYLKEAIEVRFSQAERQFSPLSVIMIDIDYFKSINDAYGHLFGDLVLKQFAKQLKKIVRPYDIIIRYGGEEFIIITSEANRAHTVILAQRILDKINLYNFGDGKHLVKLKLSLAAASYPEDNVLGGMDLIKLADEILNKTKEGGGNRVCSFLDIEKKSATIMQTSDVQFLKEKITKLTKRANQSLIEAVFAFAKTIIVKDHYTGEHAERTVYYATEIAQELNLPKEKIELIKQAAMLHDLGKVGISEEILHKNSRLNREELAEIKRHPQIGVDIIRPIRALHLIIPALLYHHERWDGKGYPNGLKKENIPLGARIVAIADVYQALVSDRPYRKAYSKRKVMEIIKEGSGTQFDPDIVKVFIKVLQRRK